MVFGICICKIKLSIAAVCTSMDPDATIYSGRYSVNRVSHNEIIENLEGMVVELLKAFQNRNTVNVSLENFILS